MATIKDIAKKAGVSIGTVSNVLNGVPTVNAAIKRTVLKIAKEMNYKPSRIAKSLVSGQSQTLAFIIPDVCNPFFPEMVRGATDKANALGYEIFLGNIDNDPLKEVKYIQSIATRGVDGLIIATSDCSSEQVIQIRNLDVPVVIVDRELEDLEWDLVIVDNVRCAKMAVKHLVDLGRKQIGIILGPLQTTTAKQRLEGAKMALQEANLFNEKLIFEGKFTFESGFQIIQNILCLKSVKIDSVFCANDMIAVGAIKAIEREGFQVPDDIAVVGFDDISVSGLIKPSLTTIRQPTYELGAIAANMVIERIQGVATGIPRKVVLPGQLIVRDSTVKGIEYSIQNEHDWMACSNKISNMPS